MCLAHGEVSNHVSVLMCCGGGGHGRGVRGGSKNGNKQNFTLDRGRPRRFLSTSTVVRQKSNCLPVRHTTTFRVFPAPLPPPPPHSRPFSSPPLHSKKKITIATRDVKGVPPPPLLQFLERGSLFEARKSQTACSFHAFPPPSPAKMCP